MLLSRLPFSPRPDSADGMFHMSTIVITFQTKLAASPYPRKSEFGATDDDVSWKSKMDLPACVQEGAKTAYAQVAVATKCLKKSFGGLLTFVRRSYLLITQPAGTFEGNH